MNACEMIRRCKEAQWRGCTPEQRGWMEQESRRGRPTFTALGHAQYPIWVVEHWYAVDWKAPANPGDVLLCVKVDRWPDEYEPWGKPS